MQSIESFVREAVHEQTLLSPLLPDEENRPLTYGERLADQVAEFGGSWMFIISLVGVLLGWTVFNSWVLRHGAVDPYPYNLLNLMLSCLAAIQAPIIMMSQHRQETKDRQRSHNDYLVNLKAEVEIRQMQEKLDELSRQHEILLDTLLLQQELLGQLINQTQSRRSE